MYIISTGFYKDFEAPEKYKKGDFPPHIEAENPNVVKVLMDAHPSGRWFP